MYPIKLPLQRAVKRGGVLHKQLLNALDTHRIGVCRAGTLHVPAKSTTFSFGGSRTTGSRAQGLHDLPVFIAPSEELSRCPVAAHVCSWEAVGC